MNGRVQSGQNNNGQSHRIPEFLVWIGKLAGLVLGGWLLISATIDARTEGLETRLLREDGPIQAKIFTTMEDHTRVERDVHPQYATRAELKSALESFNARLIKIRETQVRIEEGVAYIKENLPEK